jgi:hypothetical protein
MRISLEGNYIKIVHEEGQFNGTTASDFAKDVYMTAEGDTVTINSPRLGNLSYAVAQVTDGAGAAMTLGEIQTFATTSTGNFSTGGGGSPSSSVDIGFIDYNDAATAVTPLTFTTGVPITLTNDTLGPFTNTAYPPTGVTSIYANNQFDWSQLSLGDMLDIRVDVEVTTASPNQEVKLEIKLGIGASEYSIQFLDIFEKIAGAHRLVAFSSIYMGDSNTLDNPAEFILESDGNGSIKVNGWYCQIIKRTII